MNRFLRAASLVVTDRRWAAPLSAMALGFGLFIGVAIGPGASGTLATGFPQVIEIPSFGSSADSDDAEDPTPLAGPTEVPAPPLEPSLPSYEPAPLAPAAAEPLPAGAPQSGFQPRIGLAQATPVFEPLMSIGEASAVPAYESDDFRGENPVNDGDTG